MYNVETYCGFEALVSYGCITIYESHKTSNRKIITNVLKAIAEKHPDCKVIQKRSIKSLADEWIAHTRLYNLGIMRDHTADVDLEYPQNKLHKIAWAILGI